MLFSGLLARLGGAPVLITYEEAETYTRKLAAKLISAFGLENLRYFNYVAIPRGGHFVLGMLSYILDLPQEALVYPNTQTTQPVVVVDDCALSGYRFGRFLQQHQDKEIIFVHLCSHPALREAILSAENRVIACLTAYDLEDITEQRFPDPEERRKWQERWQERVGDIRYWIGISELVIFPWNEPDRPIWNPETNQVEDNWRLASPDRCLKNWGKLGLPPRQETNPTVRIPDQVAYTINQDDITLCNLDDETVYGLNSTAADIWRALAAYGDLAAAKDYLLELYDVDEAQLTADIHSLTDTLLAKGLLEPVNAPPPA